MKTIGTIENKMTRRLGLCVGIVLLMPAGIILAILASVWTIFWEFISAFRRSW